MSRRHDPARMPTQSCSVLCITARPYACPAVAIHLRLQAAVRVGRAARSLCCVVACLAAELLRSRASTALRRRTATIQWGSLHVRSKRGRRADSRQWSRMRSAPELLGATQRHVWQRTLRACKALEAC